MRRLVKRSFDILLALIALVACSWIIVICWLIASVETRSNGMFRQTRIGRNGEPFTIYKIKTMFDPDVDGRSSVSVAGSAGITKSGRLFRRLKLDELPQLWNVFFGQMSFVGPRPDVAGYADQLQGEDRIILDLRPGITGPASLKFRNEEDLLSQQVDPVTYNLEVIWPEKVAINRAYAKTYGLKSDIRYILQTLGI